MSQMLPLLRCLLSQRLTQCMHPPMTLLCPRNHWFSALIVIHVLYMVQVLSMRAANAGLVDASLLVAARSRLRAWNAAWSALLATKHIIYGGCNSISSTAPRPPFRSSISARHPLHVLPRGVDPAPLSTAHPNMAALVEHTVALTHALLASVACGLAYVTQEMYRHTLRDNLHQCLGDAPLDGLQLRQVLTLTANEDMAALAHGCVPIVIPKELIYGATARLGWLELSEAEVPQAVIFPSSPWPCVTLSCSLANSEQRVITV